MNNQDQNTENNSKVELSIKTDGTGANVCIDGSGMEIIATICALMEEDEVLRSIIMMCAMTFTEVSPSIKKTQSNN